MDEIWAIGRVYKITSEQTELIYIGSTIKTLKERLRKHYSNFKQYLNGKCKINYSSFELVQYNDCKIELLHEIECMDREMLRFFEQVEINKHKNCVNVVDAYFDSENYHANNRDEILAYKKKYRADNRDEILAYKKKYREDNHDKISAYNQQYREDNHENISTYNQQHYIENRDKYKTYAMTKIRCECGVLTNNAHISRHRTTIKHQENMRKLHS
jgi:hypothetical protein